jgi:hypothetical protein
MFNFKSVTSIFIKTMKNLKSVINGHLDILVHQKEDEFENVKECWNEILIHGDPEGLRSLANLLLKLADLDQESITGLPVGARAHEHLRPKLELSSSSETVIVGRLDAKGTGAFYESYSSK